MLLYRLGAVPYSRGTALGWTLSPQLEPVLLQPYKETCWVLGLRCSPQAPLASAWGRVAALDVFI